jgi:hypothetical protein
LIGRNPLDLVVAGTVWIGFCFIAQSDGVSLTKMPAQADIIVSSPDSTEVKLVVEAKLQTPDLRETEHQLKNFMLQLRCPLGLVVSPQWLWVYLDRFTSYSEDSIERLGEFDMTGLINSHFPATGSGVAFENAVQAWLEDLSTSVTRGEVKDPKLLAIINHYILPAVETGIIRAAGPRKHPVGGK